MTKKPVRAKAAQQKPKVKDPAPKGNPTGGALTKKPIVKSGLKTGVICTGCASQGDCMS